MFDFVFAFHSMFIIFDTSLYDSVLKLPTGLTETNKQRWHMAFVTIYCSRAFSCCLEAKKNNRKVSPFLPSNSVVVIDVPEPPHPCFSNIDKSSLTQLVKRKNLIQLVEKHGGIQGLASDLKTNLENGINGADEEDIRADTKLLAVTHIKGLTPNVSIVSCGRLSKILLL
ncbi:unnamed protein product [Camellia sinensis]